jgi:hypothetical protein
MENRIITYVLNISVIIFQVYLAYRITRKNNSEKRCQKHHDDILILKEKVKNLEGRI